MGKIMVLDDDIVLRTALRQLLQWHGHEVTELDDGKNCLKAYGSDPFDLLITDLYMPDTDGLEILTEFRKQAPGVRIIAISGNRNSDLMLRAAAGLGARRTLEKPVDPEQLLALVAEELERRPEIGA